MLRTWLARIRGAVLGRRMEREFATEIEAHLALLEDDLVRRGMARDQARREARRQFGGVAQVQELHREGRGLAHLERLWADLAYALRTMLRNPGFSLVAVATLALGIGVNTALFSAYNAVALKPWPVASPERVVRLERWFESRNLGDIQYAFSYPEYLYLRGHASGFAGLVAASWPVRAFAEAHGGAVMDKLQGQLVSANYFAAMGVSARLGRTFAEGEDRAPGANPVIVLSHAAWRRTFQGDASILGQTVQLNGTAFTVIGIMPEVFTGTSLFPVVPDFWAPVSMQGALAPGSNWLDAPGHYRLQILGRLKDGAYLGRAQAEASLLLQQFSSTHRELDKTLRLTLQRTSFFGNVEDPRFQAFVAGIMLIVGLVLLVACANIANLLLARTAGRQREIAVRLALGASRGRVIRQLLTESVLLALVGGAAGLVLSAWCSRLLWVAIEQVIAGPVAGTFKLEIDLRPDIRVYVYALLLSTAAGILFGLWPALRATRPDLNSATRDEGTGFGAGWTRSRLRGWLVGGQVAVSMLLLITAGLLARGLVRSRVADAGFETRGLYVLTADFGADQAKAITRQRRVIERLHIAPEVSAVAEGGVPMTGTWTPPMVAGQARGRTLASYAGEGYLETVGIPLVRGRGFSKAEDRKKRAGGRDQRSRGAPLLAGLRSAGAAIPTRSGFPRDHVGVRSNRRRQGYSVRESHPDRFDARVSDPQSRRFPDRAVAHARRFPAGAGRCAFRCPVGGCGSAAQPGGHQYRSRAAGIPEGAVSGGRRVCCRAGITGAPAGWGRDLRRDGVPGQPTHPRDRHPYGARRGWGRSGPQRRVGRPAPRLCRDGGGHRRRGGRFGDAPLHSLVPRIGRPLIRRELLRPHDVPWPLGLPACGGCPG